MCKFGQAEAPAPPALHLPDTCFVIRVASCVR